MENNSNNQEQPQQLEHNVSGSLCVCGSNKFNKSFIQERTWLGSSSASMRRYSLTDKRFNTREYSLGHDFYAATDLLKTHCKECGKVDFVSV